MGAPAVSLVNDWTPSGLCDGDAMMFDGAYVLDEMPGCRSIVDGLSVQALFFSLSQVGRPGREPFGEAAASTEVLPCTSSPRQLV